tara:strand:- start:141 stop:548 length:408 start_codon:yes stop_codon:yes gene_type:complete
MKSFIKENQQKILSFGVIGISLTILNLFLIYFFIEILNFNTYLLENVANAIVIEIGVILSFLLNRHFTWSAKKNVDTFFNLIIKFHYAVGFTAILRVFIFAFLQFLGIKYLINTILCIILSASINFFLYDRKVFK